MNDLMVLPRDVVDINEARGLIEDAIKHELAALKLNPTHRQYRFYLAQHYINLARVRRDLHQEKLAVEAMQNRIQLLEGLAEDVPGEDKYRGRLLHTKLELAGWLKPTGRAPEAERLYHEVIRGWREVIDETSAEPNDLSWLGASLNNLALLLRCI